METLPSGEKISTGFYILKFFSTGLFRALETLSFGEKISTGFYILRFFSTGLFRVLETLLFGEKISTGFCILGFFSTGFFHAPFLFPSHVYLSVFPKRDLPNLLKENPLLPSFLCLSTKIIKNLSPKKKLFWSKKEIYFPFLFSSLL